VGNGPQWPYTGEIAIILPDVGRPSVVLASDHYEPTHVELDDGVEIVSIPTNYTPWYPWWLEGEASSYDPGDPGEYTVIGVDPDGNASVILATGAGDIEPVASTRFTSAANAVLATVGVGTNDFLAADDLVAGAIWRTGARAGLVLQAGTSTVVGAVSYLGTQIDGQQVTTPPTVLTPAVLRSFSSNNDTLYALTPGGSAGS
jgi:hypothetical protein